MKLLPEGPMLFDEQSSHIPAFVQVGSKMSSTRKSLSENWLLVQWNSGGRDVVYVRSVVNTVTKDLKIGDRLMVNRRGEQEAATLIARAREREMLDGMVVKNEATAGPSNPRKQDDEDEDFSSSASDWVPSDDAASGDSDAEAKTKKIKLERYKRQYSRSSKKILTPSNKANAVINMMNRKRSHNDSKNRNLTVKKSLPDSTKKNQNNGQKVAIDVKELREVRDTFKMLFKMLDDMKQRWNVVGQEQTQRVSPTLNVSRSVHNSYSQMDNSDDYKENDLSENDEFNRSDDNVLISNKYNVGVKTVKNVTGNEEWVPIGSGKTLIHKDKFKKINWRSYTIATRTLLLAVFPRRILATHSLTGKRSPAFQNKPAKMCLDPKITSDVIMEVMDRFNVRENLVRSIITTKCADECKMWKTRNTKKKSLALKKEKTAV